MLEDAKSRLRLVPVHKMRDQWLNILMRILLQGKHHLSLPSHTMR